MSITCRSLLSAVFALALAAAPAAAAAPETPATTFAVSASAAGELADGAGVVEFTPVEISADGRYVAFQSAAQNLGPAGPVGAVEGFVKDLQTGAVELVSRADGLAGEAAAAPGITTLQLSADGRHVLFTSAATNLGTPLPEEEAGEAHVYERDLETGATTLVDRVSGAGGQILARGAEGDSLSADGSVVAFTARVANLEDPVGDHAETAAAVGYVRDLKTATTTAVSRLSGANGELGEEPAEGLALAPDGDAVTFYTRSENLDPAFPGGQYQLYLRDLATETTTLLSRNALGEAGDNNSFGGGFSADGCFLSVESSASNLLAPAESGLPSNQTYVLDRCAEPPAITLAGKAESGTLASFSYSAFEAPAITAGGGAVAFAAEFPTSRCCHLYLRDLGTGKTTILDRASGEAGAPADEQVQYFAVSASGCRVAFATAATNLGVTPAGPETSEVYVRQLKACSGVGLGGEDTAPPEDLKSPNAGSPGSPAPGVATVRRLRIEGRRLRFALSAPGSFTVRVRKLEGEPGHRWRLVREFSFAANPGQSSIPLPKLGPGRYRLNVHLAGMPEGDGFVRRLTVR